MSLLLVNKATVDQYLINKITDTTNLAHYNLLLLFNNGKCINNNLGTFIVKDLWKYLRDRDFLADYYNEKWDYAIAMSLEASNYSGTHPEYFAFLLGHEFGHLQICKHNIKTHILSCLIHENIRCASNGNITKPHQLPHEIYCNIYGKNLAIKLFGHYPFTDCIKRLIQIENNSHTKEFLQSLLLLNKPILVEQLRTELINFVLPYKSKLIEIWKRNKERGIKENIYVLEKLICDFEGIFMKGMK